MRTGKQDKKLIKEASNKTITKPASIEEARDFVNSITQIVWGPDHAFNKVAKEVLPKRNAGKRLNEKEIKLLTKAAMTLGLENQFPLADTVHERYRGLVIELATNLTREYDCKKFSERALVQAISIAYGRILEYSIALRSFIKLNSTSHVTNEYFSMLGKELDRANRHFISSLQTLAQIKSPTPDLNIKTKNTFISENQQVNTIAGDLNIQKEAENETNSSK